MAFPWKSDTVLNYLQTFLEFFHVQTWLAKLDFTSYLVIFYLCLSIVCLVILDVFYVSYSFSKKKFAFVWPMQALRTVCGLFVTVLYLPFLGNFKRIYLFRNIHINVEMWEWISYIVVEHCLLVRCTYYSCFVFYNCIHHLHSNLICGLIDILWE
jgi:hypothetical protein